MRRDLRYKRTMHHLQLRACVRKFSFEVGIRIFVIHPPACWTGSTRRDPIYIFLYPVGQLTVELETISLKMEQIRPVSIPIPGTTAAVVATTNGPVRRGGPGSASSEQGSVGSSEGRVSVLQSAFLAARKVQSRLGGHEKGAARGHS